MEIFPKIWAHNTYTGKYSVWENKDDLINSTWEELTLEEINKKYPKLNQRYPWLRELPADEKALKFNAKDWVIERSTKLNPPEKGVAFPFTVGGKSMDVYRLTYVESDSAMRRRIDRENSETYDDIFVQNTKPPGFGRVSGGFGSEVGEGDEGDEPSSGISDGEGDSSEESSDISEGQKAEGEEIDTCSETSAEISELSGHESGEAYEDEGGPDEESDEGDEGDEGDEEDDEEDEGGSGRGPEPIRECGLYYKFKDLQKNFMKEIKVTVTRTHPPHICTYRTICLASKISKRRFLNLRITDTHPYTSKEVSKAREKIAAAGRKPRPTSRNTLKRTRCNFTSKTTPRKMIQQTSSRLRRGRD
jgi:hypothetical protein